MENDSQKALASESKTLLQEALDIYFQSEQSVYEWCGLAITRLQSYLRYLENFSLNKAKLQQRAVIQLLEEGLRKRYQWAQRCNS